MISTSIIYLIETSEWETPMLIQPKNHDQARLHIFVDYCILNKLTVIGPFQTHFANKIVNEVAGHEFYSFTNDLSRFN